MDNLKVFENDEFGQLSVIVKNNKEYIESNRSCYYTWILKS